MVEQLHLKMKKKVNLIIFKDAILLFVIPLGKLTFRIYKKGREQTQTYVIRKSY